MAEIDKSIISNLSLLVESRENMRDSMNERGVKIVGGLVDFPPYIQQIKDGLPECFRVEEGFKLGGNLFWEQPNLDIRTSDGNGFFRGCGFIGKLSAPDYTFDISSFSGSLEKMFEGTYSNDVRDYFYVPEGYEGKKVYLKGDTSKITNLDYMLYDAGVVVDFRYLGGKFNNVTSMRYFAYNFSPPSKFNIDTSNVTDFVNAFGLSYIYRGLVLNLSSAITIDYMLNKAEITGQWMLFGDPSNIVSMENAFNAVRATDIWGDNYSKPILCYDPRYDYSAIIAAASEVIDEVDNLPLWEIRPLTDEEMESQFETYPNWK